jgi:hypothetical protein
MSTTITTSLTTTVPGPHGLLSARAYFLHWGVVQISLTNFIIIVLILVLFALALVLPPPSCSGRLVVGAATIAPVGADVRSLRVSAERCTISRHRPL